MKAGLSKAIATRFLYGQCRLGSHLAEGRGWGLDKNNRVDIVVVGSRGRTEIYQPIIRSALILGPVEGGTYSHIGHDLV